MKKNLLLSLFSAFVMMILASCGSKTASDKAEEMFGYLQDGDYASYVDCIAGKDGAKMSAEEKSQMTAMFEEKGEAMLKETQGIKSYEVVSEELSEDGNSATVVVNVVYGNGDSKEQPTKFSKDENGEWVANLK